MWAYKPEDPITIQRFYGTTHEKLWKEDIELDAANPYKEGWLAKAEQIDSPAPLPKDPRSDLLKEMLVVAPYKVPEKKEKKKKKMGETRDGLRPRSQPDSKSAETQALSTHEEEQDEDGEESECSHTRRRAASQDVEEPAARHPH